MNVLLSSVKLNKVMEEYLTTAQVATVLQVKPITVLRWIAAGKISAIGLGERAKEYRIAKSELEKFLDDRRVAR